MREKARICVSTLTATNPMRHISTGTCLKITPTSRLIGWKTKNIGRKYMNLKESYHYANYLEDLLNTGYTYLRNKAFVTTTKETHMRSKANVQDEDETIIVPKPYDVNFTPNDVINFIEDILDEKEKLANAIAIAKLITEFNVDNAISMNKKKQTFIGVLSSIAEIKPGDRKKQDSGYHFNVNNEQVRYYYDVEEHTSIDFDRNMVKALIKKYRRICDETSAKLDSIEINVTVDFDPKYDVSDTFEDILESKK
jgi:hypothetical protein